MSFDELTQVVKQIRDGGKLLAPLGGDPEWIHDHKYEYFSRQPLRCRARTLEFVFATGHLHRPAEGTEFYASRLDADYDTGTVAYAIALKHLGTREILPVPREHGPGRQLRLSGAGELLGWYAASPRLIDTIIRRGVDRTTVLPGLDPPDPDRVPPHCSFGGLGGHFHSHLVPTIALISGPWSLWAPSFGAGAVDFARMRRQVLAAGDIVLTLAGVSREEIAGPYLDQRRARAAGTPTCTYTPPPEEAPGDPS